MQSIVLSIGGSVLLSKEADHVYLSNFVDLLKRMSEKYKIFVIVGGGYIARNYIQLGRTFNLKEDFLDILGIEITRVNAKLLTGLIQNCNQTIPETTTQAKNMNKPIVVMGGTTPGHSTDMVGAELAKKTSAERFIIATNVNGVYDKDPNTHADAKQIPSLSIDTLIATYGTSWESAGKNMVIDGPALSIIKKAKLATFVVNGKQLDQLENVLLGKPFDGTTITI